jgi:hypothetical protein
MAGLVEAVRDGVGRLGVDARESLGAGGVLKSDLERITQGINSISALTRAAGETALKTGSSLAGAMEMSAEAARSLQSLVTAQAALRLTIQEISGQVARLADQPPTPPGAVDGLQTPRGTAEG